MERHEGPIHIGFILVGAIPVFRGLFSCIEIASILAGDLDTVGVLLSWVKEKNSLRVVGLAPS